jgi:hypothetical protein
MCRLLKLLGVFQGSRQLGFLSVGVGEVRPTNDSMMTIKAADIHLEDLEATFKGKKLQFGWQLRDGPTSRALVSSLTDASFAGSTYDTSSDLSIDCRQEFKQLVETLGQALNSLDVRIPAFCLRESVSNLAVLVGSIPRANRRLLDVGAPLLSVSCLWRLIRFADSVGEVLNT